MRSALKPSNLVFVLHRISIPVSQAFHTTVPHLPFFQAFALFSLVIFWLVSLNTYCADCTYSVGTVCFLSYLFKAWPLAVSSTQYDAHCCLPWCPHSAQIYFRQVPVLGMRFFREPVGQQVCLTFSSLSLFVLILQKKTKGFRLCEQRYHSC